MPSRFSDLKMSMVTVDDKRFPTLKGKAAEVKHIAGGLAHVFAMQMNNNDPQEQEMMAIFKHILRVEEVLDDHADDFALPPAAAAKFEESAVAIVQLTTSLANFYHPKGILLFNFTIKHHYLQHLSLICHYANPRLGLCYQGEDFMGKVKQIIQASQRGTGPAVVQKKAMLKYAQALSMTFLSQRSLRG